MSSDDLPAELKAFIFACIDAVEQVELLTRLHPGQSALSAHAVGEALGVSAAVARHHLETLSARGLLRVEIGDEVRFRYAPRSARLRHLGDALVAAQAADRLAVLRAVAQNANRSLKSFADAFKLRGTE